MSTPRPDMSSDAITARLRHASGLSDLAPEKRLEGKLDMSAAAVTARLKEAASLLQLCRVLSGAQQSTRQSP